MKLEHQNICLSFIEKEWKQVRARQAGQEKQSEDPWAVWIRLYAPIPINQNDLSDLEDTIAKTWFLTKNGIEERNPWEYARFITAKGYLQWPNWWSRPRDKIWGDQVHQIALAAFANIIDHEEIYLELQWGGRWGSGYHMEIDKSANKTIIQPKHHVWRS